MDLVVNGRGVRVTEQMRKSILHKLSKLERVDPRVWRLEVEIIEAKPRIDGGHRVEVACDSARRRYRAQGSGQDLDIALDQVVERLERQIVRYRGKARDRRRAGPGRLESRETSPGGASNPE